MKVVFFQRKPYPFHKSIELIFDGLRRQLANKITPVTHVFAHYSKNILPRLGIVLEAKRKQGDVNHITGDIHFAAILLNKEKTILTVHDCGMLAASTGLKHQLLKYFWFTLPFKKCRFITTVSETTKRELLRYAAYPQEDIHVIYNSISTAYVYRPAIFNAAKPAILHIGTTFNKNLERLIDAIKEIHCRLNIIGRLSDEIKVKLAEAKIDYTNYYDISEAELVKQYQECDLLSFVSTYEGFGMPIIEANTVGRPVVTSNLSCMPEIAGDAACLVDPYSVSSIKEGIQSIIDNETYRNTLVKNGLQNCKRFDAALIATQYLHLYKKIAGTN